MCTKMLHSFKFMFKISSSKHLQACTSNIFTFLTFIKMKIQNLHLKQQLIEFFYFLYVLLPLYANQMITKKKK